jgi:hypothetical protein
MTAQSEPARTGGVGVCSSQLCEPEALAAAFERELEGVLERDRPIREP